jgi:Fe-S-cluster containining protein
MDVSTGMLLEKLPEQAKKIEIPAKTLFKRLKKKPPKNLDVIVHEFHERAFENIDCLSCANCCKTLGPRISDNDIKKISSYLKLKPGKFIELYLILDEDGDYIFKNMPCPFLLPDNYCMIYQVRPKACKEYPHTDSKKFHRAFDITLKNIHICPAAAEVVEKMIHTFNKG